MSAGRVKVSGVAAIFFDRFEVVALGTVHSVAAVAVVNIPVTTALLHAGVFADLNLVGIDDVDTAVKGSIIVGRALGELGVLVIFLSAALGLNVTGLGSLVIDVLGILGNYLGLTAVNTVVPDDHDGIEMDRRLEDVLVGIYQLGSVAGPVSLVYALGVSCVVAGLTAGLISLGALPEIDAGVVNAVLYVILVIPAGGITAVSTQVTVVAVRHHEINSLGVFSIKCHLFHDVGDGECDVINNIVS